MKKMQRRVLLAATAAALAASVVLPAAAAAKPSTNLHNSVRTTIEVVYEGLNTPRGVAWDPYRFRVLVAEAGVGGDAPCAPGYGGVMYCYGNTGSIFSYSPLFGTKRRIVENMPSIRNEVGTASLGIHDLAVYRGQITGVFGLSGLMSTRDAFGPQALPLAQTARINEWTDRITPVGDLMAFEEAHDPDGHIDSNPYGLATGSYGTVVADAAGNSVLHVAHDGTVSLLAAMPNVETEDDWYESVPTSVVRGPDGAFYISELTGYDYPAGESRVWRLVPGQNPTVHATGFTNVVDLAFDRKGRMLVLEMSMNGLTSGDNTGRLVRIERNGSQTVLATDGLEHPGGIAVAPNGDLYVTNRTDSFGDASGQLLRIRVRG